MFTQTIASRAASAAPTTACRACQRSRSLFAMPLRAKLLSQQQLPSQRQISTRMLPTTKEAYEQFKPRDGDEPEDVLFDSLYGLRSIELNRPKKLNALNGSMIRKIAPRMIEWAKSDMANVIVMKGAGEKAFCAGGDVGQLAIWNKEGPEGQAKSAEYFAQEYRLDHLIATFNKPYIAFMDGITMGGGVGLSIHAPFRIATERTVFAMPETNIGFFPDVGASFFLPRMPGYTGTYLALTSDRLTGANAFYSGVATHYLHSTSLPRLESRLAELRFRDTDDLPKRLAVINATIEEFVTGLPYDEPIQLGGHIRRAIDRCFKHDSVDAIMRALAKEQGATRNWARQTMETLHKRSPLAVHVALRQMRIGAKWNIHDTFVREHAMARKFMATHDFTEGVTALLLEKRPAMWQPAATLDDIKPEDSAALTEDFFLVPKDAKPLELITKANYDEYPHATLGFGVPSEKEVEDKVALGTMTREQVLDAFVRERKYKQGVKEVVGEILERKTKVSPQGLAMWDY